VESKAKFLVILFALCPYLLTDTLGNFPSEVSQKLFLSCFTYPILLMLQNSHDGHFSETSAVLTTKKHSLNVKQDGADDKNYTVTKLIHIGITSTYHFIYF